jgi:hypothetical protein
MRENQMTNEKRDKSSLSLDQSSGKISKSDDLKYVHLSAFLSDSKVKVSELVKSSKALKEKFDEERETIKIEKFDASNPVYLDRMLEIVPRLIGLKDRVMGKKIVAAIFERYGISPSVEFPPAIQPTEEFFSRQKNFLAHKLSTLNNNREYRSLEEEEKFTIEKSIIFEFKLLRLLTCFVSSQNWFTTNILLKAMRSFSNLNRLSTDYSFRKAILSLANRQKSSIHLAAIVNEFGSTFDESREEAQLYRNRTHDLQIELNERKKTIESLNQQVRNLDADLNNLKERLSEQEQAHESDRRISSVGQSEINARVQKSISTLIRDEINLITEMLSDGDEFNGRVLRQVNSLKNKLEELKSWTSSSD